MNQDLENKLPGAENDPTVSAAYRAAATERTPPALDESVLKSAKAAAKYSGLRGFTVFWFRPLAFVATVGLSLALLLELTSPPDLQSVQSPESDVGHREAKPTAADPIPAVIDTTRDARSRVDSPVENKQSAKPPAPAQAVDPNLETGRRQDLKVAPAAANALRASTAPVADERMSADFAEMIEASSKQMSDKDSATETAIQQLSTTSVTDDLQAENVSAYRITTAATIVTTRPCTEEQVAVSVTWWQCISNLEEAGRHDDAKAELELFNKAHPDFEAPQILPSQ